MVLVDNSAGRVNLGKLRSLVSWSDIIQADRSGSKPDQTELQPDEVINIQFTSGTTSLPKAACLTHRGILNNGNSIGVSRSNMLIAHPV